MAYNERRGKLTELIINLIQSVPARKSISLSHHLLSFFFLERVIMQHHPDSEAANEIAAIVMKHLGWVKLDKRYAIANDVLNWLDSRKKDSVETKK